MLDIYLYGATLVCLIFLGLSLANGIALRRLNLAARKIGSPKVSVMIPARDEEHNIRACLDSLLDQDYSNYEILVLDDNSTDGTSTILREYADKSPLVRTFQGKQLAPGWLGKHYACQQLAELADGDYLLFTDADTVHQSRSISWAMTNMLDHDADFLSAYPRQTIGSLGEAIIIPAIYLVMLFLPVWLIPRKNGSLLSFAIGQFVISRASAFWAVGGYEKIKDSLVDDISMARNLKSSGFKTLFLDGYEYVNCRMYRGYREAFSGLVKNTYAALGKSLLPLFSAVAVITFAFLLPTLILLYQLATGTGNPLLTALPVLVFFLLWVHTLTQRRLPVYVAFLHTPLFCSLIAIAVVSTLKTGYGKGALWKRRWVK